VLASLLTIGDKKAAVAVKVTMPTSVYAVELINWKIGESSRRHMATIESRARKTITPHNWQSLLTRYIDRRHGLTSQVQREVYYDVVASACVRLRWTCHLLPLMGCCWVPISDSALRDLMQENVCKLQQPDTSRLRLAIECKTLTDRTVMRRILNPRTRVPILNCNEKIMCPNRAVMVRIFPQAERTAFSYIRRHMKDKTLSAANLRVIIF